MRETTRYRRIAGGDYRHVWVVGDLHGCYRPLLRALAARRFSAHDDLLISVGDMIDRGPESAACLALLYEPWFTAIVGNHERMAQEAADGGNGDLWRYNGGEWYFELDGAGRRRVDALIQRAARLPLIIEVNLNGRRYVIAHADYPSDRYAFGYPVDADDVVWSRRRIRQSLAGVSRCIVGASLFIFGHTPLDKPRVFANQLYLDTGAVFGGPLTLIRLR